MKDAILNVFRMDHVGANIILIPGFKHGFKLDKKSGNHSDAGEQVVDLKTLGIKPGLEHDASMTRDDLWQNGDNLHFKPELCNTSFKPYPNISDP